MEESLRQGSQFDRETDPTVIATRRALFDKYVEPFKHMVYFLTRQYSRSLENVQENYTSVLTALYRGIETYNPEREIRTWLHICTKRQVFDMEERRLRYAARIDHNQNINAIVDAEECCDLCIERVFDLDNYRELYNDDILEVLDSMDPIHRDALLLQEAGYSLKEIAEIEQKKGTLNSGNINTVKSRLFLARQKLKKELTRDGTRKTG